ncbi:MAG: Asp-tRNA(Asn)/Glu-tRNA(Gln) amidotransferase subunit GatB [Acidobacteria bacterium]|nr:Asp-tRNA(Asn)/Glu-tRNA(Gln) amidotransferase subunit GatB [Acidobacteriota bacterium]
MRAVIGLEVHVQLGTRTKLFCACPAEFGGEPNSRTCPVCLGLPGALPMPNAEAVRLALRAALALGCAVHEVSTWARKNYFYPDLPKGYQITQYDRPLATGGRVRIEPPDGARWVGVRRVHLEEDAGKSLHDLVENRTALDFNRCGVPLVEIVAEPEIVDPGEAQLYLERVRALMRSAQVSEAEMEQGSLRCDANISLHREGEPWGARVELKNLNSFRHVRRALEHEIGRQSAAIAAGTAVRRETRLWDEVRGCTRALRSKEEEEDYRYFDEPDLPPLVLAQELVERERANLPEPVHARRDRFVAALGLSEADAQRLTLEPALADYFERVASASDNPRAAAAWVLSELLGALHARGLPLSANPMPAEQLAALVRLAADGEVSGPGAKQVFAIAFETGGEPARIVSERGLRRLRDPAELEQRCRAAIAAHPAQAEAYRRGRAGVLSFFVGQIVQATAGRADPARAREILERLLAPGPR